MVTALVGFAVIASLLWLTQPFANNPSVGGGSASSPPASTSFSPTAEAQPSSPPTPTQSSAVAPESVLPTPVATSSPTSVPCCPAVPTPVASGTLAESDSFWDHWAARPFPRPRPDPGSLQEALGYSDLVVRGHIVDLYIGEYWLELPDQPRVALAYAKVAVSESYKGSPVWRDPGYIEVDLGRLDPAGLDALRKSLPRQDSIWFLRYGPDFPRDDANQSDIAPYEYLLLNPQQGVLRDIDGKVRVVKPEYLEPLGPNEFPLGLEGTGFNSLVAQMQAIAETLPASPTDAVAP